MGTEHKVVAQQNKARKIAFVCEMTEFKISADECKILNEDQWQMLANIADVKLPSKETRALVIAELEARAKSKAKLAILTEEELFAPFRH